MSVKLNEIKELFDRLFNTNIAEGDIAELSSEDCQKIVKVITDAKAEAERLHILDIMKKVCK